MLNCEQAKTEILKRLPAYEHIWGTPVCIVDEETKEYEWGWSFVCRPIDPNLVPPEIDPLPSRRLLVEKLNGNVEIVASSGMTLALIGLMRLREQD